MSKEVKAALIGGVFAIVAAIIAGLFALHSTASVQSNASPTSPIASSTSTLTQPNQSATFPLVATQPAQSTYPDIRGTYDLMSQNTVTRYSVSVNFVITQQNQQNFQGALSKDYQSTPINGIVDQNGDIQFTDVETDTADHLATDVEADTAGNQVTITFTGTAQSGGSWQGTWSASDSSQGTWSAV
jgi:hypothetical protein